MFTESCQSQHWCDVHAASNVERKNKTESSRCSAPSDEWHFGPHNRRNPSTLRSLKLLTRIKVTQFMNELPGEATRQSKSAAGVRTRQLYLTLTILLLALWMALPFLTPIAWAAVFAIAEWPLFKRAERYLPGRPFVLALIFTSATTLLVILPLSIAAVSLAQESQTALDWIQHVQHDGLPTPGWVAGLPLAGGHAARWWQDNLSHPRGANALLGTISAGSALGWTRFIAGEVARESALFLVTLVI
ncbi:hypothetical protein SPAN111604_14460 [Sphingomonas antarctica]|uniref:AI-2E family transporter n=1 Tax=Sphingomonas antarctica TaxID=2040274 RepID=UPI0039E8A0AF